MADGKTKSSLYWISEVTGNRKRFIVYLIILQGLQGGIGVLYAILLRDLVDTAVAGNGHAFILSVIRFAAVVILQIMVCALGRFLSEWTRSAIENRFKARLFSVLLKKDYASVTTIHSGEWMNRLTSDTVVIADGLAQVIPGMGGMLVKLAGAMIAVLALEPVFAAVLIPGGLAILLLSRCFRKVLKRLHRRVQEKDGMLRVLLQERLGSMMIIRAFGMETLSRREAERAMEEHRIERIKRNRFSNFCNTGFSAAMNGLYLFGAAFCGYGILQGSISYGTLMAILQLVSQIQSPFANLTGYFPQYYAMLASAERLKEAEAYPEEEGVPRVSAEEIVDFYEHSFQGIALREVSFSYKGENQPIVLNKVSLNIRKGDHVALTGASGCGKSTLLKLLMCFYPLDGGTSSLIGADGIETPLTAAWRGLFAYVPQGNQLMSGSIREIIAFGDRGRMKEEGRLWNALHIACADTFVRELEMGMDTLLGERGCGLSEGQMQRIAIARAICSERPILLLDESTSALDEKTERQLLDNLKAMTDKTVLIVTHRPAALAVCKMRFTFGERDGERRWNAAGRNE